MADRHGARAYRQGLCGGAVRRPAPRALVRHHRRGRGFGDVIASLLPDFRVQEMNGKGYGASEKEARGHVHVTLSGGLSHVYFAERETRMDYAEVGSLHPELAPGISSLQQVGLVMA